MSDEVTAYPLAWPTAKPRTKAAFRQSANFGRQVTKTSTYSTGTHTYKQKEKLTIDQARSRLSDELSRLGAKLPVISTNLRLRNDGFPQSNQREPEDPGVACYFKFDGVQQCIAIDLWDRVADNLAAIAHSIDALRGLKRWGGGQMVTAAFSGFKALPPGGSVIVTPAMMSVTDAANVIAIEAGEVTSGNVATDVAIYQSAWRRAAMKLHPDKHGGNTLPAWTRLQAAKDVMTRHFKL
jgi:hypothetical protein